MKKHNFNAGPSILADEVYESAVKAIQDFNGSGLSILSISHRTPAFDAVMAEADSLFRELLNIPDNYKIFYIGHCLSILYNGLTCYKFFTLIYSILSVSNVMITFKVINFI